MTRPMTVMMVTMVIVVANTLAVTITTTIVLSDGSRGSHYEGDDDHRRRDEHTYRFDRNHDDRSALLITTENDGDSGDHPYARGVLQPFPLVVARGMASTLMAMHNLRMMNIAYAAVCLWSILAVQK